MTKVTVLFIVISLLLFIAFEKTESSDIDANMHKGKQLSPMWFGPRIGRRKRNEEPNGSDKDQDNYLDLDSPFYITTRASKNFIPRLGRDSGESLNSWLENRDFIISKPVTNRASNHFNQGLGMSFSRFYPRLGREIE